MKALGGLAAATVFATSAGANAGDDAADDDGLTAFADKPPAPALTLTDLDGHRYDLAAFRGHGLLVNFWATWCGPCVGEMASLERAWSRVRESGVTVLAVNAGDDQDKVRRFLARTQVSFPVLLDPTTRVAAAWQVRGLPTSYVVDADGRLAAGALGSRDWDRPALIAALTRIATPRTRHGSPPVNTNTH